MAKPSSTITPSRHALRQMTLPLERHSRMQSLIRPTTADRDFSITDIIYFLAVGEFPPPAPPEIAALDFIEGTETTDQFDKLRFANLESVCIYLFNRMQKMEREL